MGSDNWPGVFIISQTPLTLILSRSNDRLVSVIEYSGDSDPNLVGNYVAYIRQISGWREVHNDLSVGKKTILATVRALLQKKVAMLMFVKQTWVARWITHVGIDHRYSIGQMPNLSGQSLAISAWAKYKNVTRGWCWVLNYGPPLESKSQLMADRPWPSSNSLILVKITCAWVYFFVDQLAVLQCFNVSEAFKKSYPLYFWYPWNGYA